VGRHAMRRRGGLSGSKRWNLSGLGLHPEVREGGRAATIEEARPPAYAMRTCQRIIVGHANHRKTQPRLPVRGRGRVEEEAGREVR
jgi:hypothetical protein